MANSSSSKSNIICLLGPTASGKTKMVVDLVSRYPFEIINVDSAQIYRGMDIGTAKPDQAILEAAPHRLLDIKDPSEVYSAADFRLDAIKEINSIISSGKTPLLVGGTMLYFKVLRDGLAYMPHADSEIRAEITEIAINQGWPQVHQRLAMVDPESAARIHPNDTQRLQRALEVYLISGKNLSAFHSEEQIVKKETNHISPFNLHFFGIQPYDRAILHKRIASRFHEMLEDGFVGEVKTLYQREDLYEMLPAIKSVGYRQAWRYLSGEIDYDQMVEQSIIATRQLAKRQLTWLRTWDNIRSLGEPSDESVETILKYVESISI